MSVALSISLSPQPAPGEEPPRRNAAAAATTETPATATAPTATVDRLVRRALGRAALDGKDWSARARRAAWVPALELGATAWVAPPTPPTANRDAWLLTAALGWPLERTAIADAEVAREESLRARHRQLLAERVAELVRAEHRATDEAAHHRDGDPLTAALRQLRAAELRAELEALAGDSDEREDACDAAEDCP